MSRITLKTVASALNSITVANNSTLVASVYSNFILRSFAYGSTTEEARLNMQYGDANQVALFSSAGVKWDFPSSDGVHLIYFLAGKVVPGSQISANGSVLLAGGASLSGIKWISVGSDRYTLYRVTSGKVTGVAEQTDVDIVIYDESEEPYLCLISSQKFFQEQLRIRSAVNQCQGPFSFGLFADIASAMAKFLCGDYRGANVMIDHITKTCGCA